MYIEYKYIIWNITFIMHIIFSLSIIVSLQ